MHGQAVDVSRWGANRISCGDLRRAEADARPRNRWREEAQSQRELVTRGDLSTPSTV